jgi:hypothetical protein
VSGKGRVKSHVSAHHFGSMDIKLQTPDIEITQKFSTLSSPEDVAELLELSSYDFLEYLLFVLPRRKQYSRTSIPKKSPTAT